MRQIYQKEGGQDRPLATRFFYIPYIAMIYWIHAASGLRFWSVRLTSVSINFHLGMFVVILGGRPQV